MWRARHILRWRLSPNPNAKNPSLLLLLSHRRRITSVASSPVLVHQHESCPGLFPASPPHAAAAYQESVSTIDFALCGLPVLARHLRQVLPGKASSPSSPLWLEEAAEKKKSFSSAAATATAMEESAEEMEEFGREASQKEEELSQPSVSNRTSLEDHLKMHRRLTRRQKKMEMEAHLKAVQEYKDMITEMCTKNQAPNLPFVRSLLLGWFEPFRDVIAAEQEAVRRNEWAYDRSNYGPFFLLLPPEMLAVVTMHRLMALLMREHEQGCVRLIKAAIVIGEAVEQEVEIYQILSKHKKKQTFGKASVEGEAKPIDGQVALEKTIQKLIKQQQYRSLGKTLKKARVSEPWGSAIQVKVGARLIELMTEVAYVHSPPSQCVQESIEVRPALRHMMKTVANSSNSSRNRVVGMISCDPLVYKALSTTDTYMEIPYMPMLVEPRQWKGYSDGGYLVLRSRLMRTHGAKSQQLAVSQADRSQMSRVYEALNTLGATPWRVNKRVHDVVEKIWEEGGCLADLVERKDEPLPPKPDSGDAIELKKWKKESFKVRRLNMERHAQRCDTELKLEVARKFRDEERFYYPHNLDFRGRAYPMHPYLNHLGSDLCRGLLEFADPRPLGPRGLHWLKVHLANIYANGVDKLSFEGREAFVDEHIDEIFDSARKPLEGNRWWLKAEDPFQCLAACFTLHDALNSGNIEGFLCHTPVQQDGSCNGLQHYAALGRDRGGAESVNLTNGEKPADVYSGIATRVREMMETDALKDPATNRSAALARLLLDYVDRKLVKQTVMTSVYGVTFVGARCQILNRLEERGNQDNPEMFRASSYAAKTTLNALGQMFKEARCIMGWLSDCAKLIASQNEAVRWTTVLGLPVVQPYRKPGWKQVKTSLQILTLRNDSDQPVVVARQKSAFPPNFVHSLDSTHMMMTATACRKAGLVFAGVHDSFWTHAGDVEIMNRILREKFVELYEQPILENLLQSFQENFPQLEFPPVPKRGDFDLNQVVDATYFFN